MTKPRILLTYLVYPLAMATYFRKALQHRGDIDLKVAGTYTGSWIPWMGGMNLPEKYAIPPDIPLPFRPDVVEYNYDIIQAYLEDWVPDLIIQVDAGFHFKYRPSNGMVVTVGTDPHVLNDWYETPRRYSDKFFNMQLVYSRPKDIYLPYAYSKYDVYPDDTVSKDIDAALLGLQYEKRVAWIARLRSMGMNIVAENGLVFDEARAIYNRAKIGLNWSTMDDLNCRAFELPAYKICPVMNYVPDIRQFLEPDVDFLQFGDLQEGTQKAMWALLNPDKAKEMAERAYHKILPHTFDARVETILKECGILS